MILRRRGDDDFLRSQVGDREYCLWGVVDPGRCYNICVHRRLVKASDWESACRASGKEIARVSVDGMK